MKIKKIQLISVLGIVFFSFLVSLPLSLAQTPENEQPKIAGKFFDVDVPIDNYNFAKRAVVTFGAKWRGTPQTPEELEDLVWQELLFSFEAFRRGITATDEEIDEEIEKILKANKVEFSWRTDKTEFEKWTEDTLRCTIESFRNQVEHLTKIEKLRQEIIDSIEPEVTEEEAYQKFLNEYNTLMVELKQFDEKEAAEAFFEKAKKSVTEKDVEGLIWEDLLASYEAQKRKIAATEEEVDKAITKLLRTLEAHFQWQKDEEAYKKWVKEQFGLDIVEFRRQISLFATIDTLIQKIAKQEEKEIDKKLGDEFLKKSGSIKKAYPKFIKEYAKKSKDILQFDDLKKAKEFYAKIKREAGFWADERRKDPNSFKVPGFVALDFLINMWGFQQGDAQNMLEQAPGTYYPPSHIYKGYGVFKVLKVRKADLTKYEERKNYYFDKMKQIKQYEGYKKWVEDLKQKANIERYVK